MLWCDDNWGDIRRLPTADERNRTGGAGIYYHFDYVGGPRNYKWINTNPDHQSVGADEPGASLRRGPDLDRQRRRPCKPTEFPTEFFLTLAWDPDAWPKEKISRIHPALGRARVWRRSTRAQIADMMSAYTKYNGRRKPELLDPDTSAS